MSGNAINKLNKNLIVGFNREQSKVNVKALTLTNSMSELEDY